MTLLRVGVSAAIPQRTPWGGQSRSYVLARDDLPNILLLTLGTVSSQVLGKGNNG
jgi:hypothetical protein